MRCPACGHDNSNLATRCAKCGATLPTHIETDSTAPQAMPADTEGTAERPQAAVESPEPSVSEKPQLRDVAGVAGKVVSSKRQQIGTFFSTHQRALGIGLALLVVGVLGGAWFVINLFDAPAYTQIEADMSALLQTYEYAGGTYGPDLSIPLSHVGVTERSSTKTPEGLEVTGDVGPTAFDVEAEATFDDGKMRVVRNVDATYVRAGGEWKMAGDLAERGMSLTARAGVDEGKVINNIGSILDAVDTGSSASLADIYGDGEFSIVGNAFKEAADKDTATNDVTIHCAKSHGFYSYEGNVIAHFAFESGTWMLRSAEADSGADKRTYAPLVGTWTGELTSTSSNGAGDCYGARDHDVQISIDSVGDSSAGGGQVQGTITVLAHHHERLEKAEYVTEGDELLERVNFTGTIRTSRDEESASSLSIDCSTTGSPDGEVDFTITFGTYDDPSSVIARVTSTYTYEEIVLLFIPHQTTAEFVDTYTLRRS